MIIVFGGPYILLPKRDVAFKTHNLEHNTRISRQVCPKSVQNLTIIFVKAVVVAEKNDNT